MSARSKDHSDRVYPDFSVHVQARFPAVLHNQLLFVATSRGEHFSVILREAAREYIARQEGARQENTKGGAQ